MLFASLAMLAACASIVEGTDQSVTVNTQPPGAKCDLVRDGATIAIVNPTPGVARIDKSKDHVAVQCELAEHEPVAGTLASSFQGMTFGNILFGGVVGVAIDASSGAINKYPPSIALILPPISFPTAQARDAYYDDLDAKARAESEKDVSAVISRCGSPNSDICKKEIELLENSRDTRLADLAAMRNRAKISG